ncbi:23S rRNA (pseudouridine(1915)-N(3))-methyltransferase RlmH [Desulfoscipio geothermicus]|uniref:Ribosomal RNA large subunit methyltransferase H n=1 Tax=Desulfoscipio geothermicus DSM 3669 TaxID=1121426 RepID=A0A1I6CZC9_9FIRM|nr:23S rRNA (pseudouridine(1915)-N(3))-methyltransferase RlmH [Desulfoscipio geothermicus]SFQ98481.1 23S rRNA (pseudouridine1915-N3)-methyltransferase [Desulfoscipio geothermicus DSM 3669]
MRITVAAVGKLKEKHWRDAIKEYSKRLGAYCRLEICEVPDEGFADGLSAAEEEKVKEREWQRLSRSLRTGTYIVALDVQGEQVASEELSARLDKLALGGQSDITFLIGGTLGLADQALRQANWRLSFSRMTFPHQLMRVILLEQIYRAFKISRGEPYHK